MINEVHYPMIFIMATGTFITGFTWLLVWMIVNEIREALWSNGREDLYKM